MHMSSLRGRTIRYCTSKGLWSTAVTVLEEVPSTRLTRAWGFFFVGKGRRETRRSRKLTARPLKKLRVRILSGRTSWQSSRECYEKRLCIDTK